MKRLLALVLLSACGGPSGALAVIGTVAGDPPVKITEVRALRGGRVAAAAPVADDGSFVLALGAGDGAKLELRGSGLRILVGKTPDSPVTIDVCGPGALFDLGNVTYTADVCGPTEDCKKAQDVLTQCLSGSGHHGPEQECDPTCCEDQLRNVEQACSTCVPEPPTAVPDHSPPGSGCSR